MWYYDYNASYPARMVEGVDGKGNYPFPGSFAYREKGTLFQVEEYDGICHAKIKAPYSYFPILSWRSEKLLNPYGTFEGWFTNHELRMAMDEGYEVKPGKMILYFETFKPFKEAVLYLYKLRQKYKLEQNPFEQLVKLLMNGGLFGKWGTNFMKMEELIAEDKISFDKNGTAVVDGEVLKKYKMNQVLVSRNKEMDSPAYSFPILSEYTTMLGRVKLWKDCKPYFKYLSMNDTDSALMTKPCFESSNELGDFKLEAVIDEAMIIRPKLYAKRRSLEYRKDEKDDGWDTKSKGVGRFLKGHDKFFKGIEEGHVEMSRFMRMREGFRADIKPGSVIVFDKKINTEDDKRDWKGQSFSMSDWQDSEPIKVIEGCLPRDVLKAQQEELDRKLKEKRSIMHSDLFDLKSKGYDISDDEYFKNETDYHDF